jgi:hypothetical protein
MNKKPSGDAQTPEPAPSAPREPMYTYNALPRREIPDLTEAHRVRATYGALNWQRTPKADHKHGGGTLDMLMHAVAFCTADPSDTSPANAPNALPYPAARKWTFEIRTVSDADRKAGKLYPDSNIFDGKAVVLEIVAPNAPPLSDTYGFKRLETAVLVAEAIAAVRDCLLFPGRVASLGQRWEADNNGAPALFSHLVTESAEALSFAMPGVYPENGKARHFAPVLPLRAADTGTARTAGTARRCRRCPAPR